MAAYDNTAVAAKLDLAADLLEISGADRFRVLGYRKAARAIRELDEPVAVLVDGGRLTEVPGVGAKMASSIEQTLLRGSFEALDEVRAKVPAGLSDVMHVSGVGPKRAAQLHAKLGVESVADLAQALREGSVAAVGGFGTKSAERIAQGVEAYERHRERVRIGVALPLAESLAAQLRAAVPEALVAIAGSVRRGEESVGNINLVGASEAPEVLAETFAALPAVDRVVELTPREAVVELHDGIAADLHVDTPDAFGELLQRFTGNARHNAQLHEIAARRGVSLYGASGRLSEGRGADGQSGTSPRQSEEAFYASLGLATPPPEIRWGEKELEHAERDTLPLLLSPEDVRGDLHSHTTYTDGRGTLADNRAAAASLGYEYLAVTDHAFNLRMVGGMDTADLERQWAEVEDLNARGDGPRILKGIELNVGDDGSLDYDDALLARFDIVLASLHSGWDQSEAEATSRLIAAIENPWVDVIAHPTGRVIGRRDPVRLNMDAVLAAAGETGTIMEINSYPDRLDLSAENLRLARRYGVRFSLGTDAHSPGQLTLMRYGVSQARRGMVVAAELLNAWPWETARTWLKRAKTLGQTTG